MAVYEIRFLRPDGTYGTIAPIKVPTDEAATTYVIEHYAQNSLEVWRGDQRLTRRTSPAYERRLNNDPHYPSQPRFAAMSSGEEWAELTYRQYEAVGWLSDRVFQSVRTQLTPHLIWIRSTGHPQAPPQVDQKVQVSVVAGAPFGDELSGNIHCDLWSRLADGATVFDDCRDIVVAALVAAVGREVERPGQVTVGPPWRDGTYNYLPISVGWTITIPQGTLKPDLG